MKFRFCNALMELEPLNGFDENFITREVFMQLNAFVDKRGDTVNFGTAWYVAEPYAEIYVFIDEEPSDLPESAVKIVDEKEPEVFLATLQPYFVMAGDS